MGPRLLGHLCGWLASLPVGDPALREVDWWIVPDANPDGAARNRAWRDEPEEAYDLTRYLAHVVRELPGDDLEFGFPRGPADTEARPETRAIRAWWETALEGPGRGPFHLHASLHGMGFGAGPWFLLEPAWRDRAEELMARCGRRARELGYQLHDVERLGEKGFLRLGPGFCTRPDSRAMRAYFLGRGEPETAAHFRPSSMETARSLGGDPLTLVSEMPLFLTPGVGERLGPPDPEAERWQARVERWRRLLADPTVELTADPTADASADPAADAAADAEALAEAARAVGEEARAAGLRPMPVRDQMDLQWTFLTAGLDEVARRTGRSEPVGGAPARSEPRGTAQGRSESDGRAETSAESGRP